MKNALQDNVVKKGTDQQFLLFLHGLLELHGEDNQGDILYRLRNVITGMDKEQRNKLNYKDSSYEEMMSKLTEDKEESINE